ncbi:hypothetical protein K1719_021663 [Acacia pycnantha]|nr:hypothetical protein K1719_021663 [Acacia pycnantha]
MASIGDDAFVSSPDMEKFLCKLLLDSTQPISERFRALFSLRNLKGPSPRDALILATRDSSKLLAHEVALDLGQMQDVEAIPALTSVLNDLSLHPIAAEALGAIGSDSNVPLLKNSLDLDLAQEHTNGASCSSVDQLREVLLDEEKGMYERYAALLALRNNGGNEVVAAIIDSLDSKSALLRHEVAYVLGQLQDKAAFYCTIQYT